VPTQKEESLNLRDAVLLQGSPPPMGKKDFSGIRMMTALEFLGNKGDAYLKIIVGYPPQTTSEQLAEAGEIAQKIGQEKSFSGKPVFYSLPFLRAFVYIKNFDYNNHLFLNPGIPHLAAKKINNSYFSWETTYCGDLVGKVYFFTGIKNLPKARVFGFAEYRSSTFYEWFRKNDSLVSAVAWNQLQGMKF
jgi:hypothetical protein